ncbi:MAG: class I SAM-dependent methyltransferase [Candidatus Riflemargulisbacteria bacterium]
MNFKLISMGVNILQQISVGDVSDKDWDKRLGIDTGDEDYIMPDRKMDIDDMLYLPTPYIRLAQLFMFLKKEGLINSKEVFVDIGCGKGRILLMAILAGLKHVVGVDIDSNVLNVANININKFMSQLDSSTLFEGDILSYKPTNETIFYLYFPFSHDKARALLNNIKNSLIENPRTIRIILRANRYSDVLQENSDWLVPRETGVPSVYMYESI